MGLNGGGSENMREVRGVLLGTKGGARLKALILGQSSQIDLANQLRGANKHNQQPLWGPPIVG